MGLVTLKDIAAKLGLSIAYLWKKTGTPCHYYRSFPESLTKALIVRRYVRQNRLQSLASPGLLNGILG